MGFNFKNFVRNAGHSIKRFGGAVNRGFNVVKHHAKRVLPVVKNAAGLIRDAAKEWSSMPVVGQAASTIGQAAGLVHRGADYAERVFDIADRAQGSLGIDRSLR